MTKRQGVAAIGPIGKVGQNSMPRFSIGGQFDSNGKVAVVMGSGSAAGIGRSTAVMLAEMGAAGAGFGLSLAGE